MYLNTKIIDDFRRSLKLSKENFAIKIQTTRVTYDKLLSNKTCHVKVLCEIARLMKVHPGELFIYQPKEGHWGGDFSPHIESQQPIEKCSVDRIALLEEKLKFRDEQLSHYKEKISYLESKMIKKGYDITAEP